MTYELFFQEYYNLKLKFFIKTLKLVSCKVSCHYQQMKVAQVNATFYRI